MTKRVLLSMAVALVMVLLVTARDAQAGTTNVICTEDSSTGCVTDLFVNTGFAGEGYMVASDGEASFDPFGAGYDTSDGVNFSAVGPAWALDPSTTGWVDLGNQIFVLPANLGPCGIENEPTCEPVGLFVSPGAPWTDAVLGTYTILEADGSVSDVIKLYNANGNAYMSFASDPIGTPEPGSLLLLGTGLLGLAGMFRRKLEA